jgi:hypothetical protein
LKDNVAVALCRIRVNDEETNDAERRKKYLKICLRGGRNGEEERKKKRRGF